MTQPLERNCELPVLGELDTETGEFWSVKTMDMPKNKENVSAYERKRLFLNNGRPEFVDASFVSGCDIDSDSRSAIAADFDRDGATDLLVASVGGGALRLFKNVANEGGDHHSVTIRLFGVMSNITGLGSRITIECGDRKVIRDLFAANGCLGLGPPELTIGVGEATKIDRLTIDWAGGGKQVLKNQPVDGLMFIKQGNDQPRFATYRQLSGS